MSFIDAINEWYEDAHGGRPSEREYVDRPPWAYDEDGYCLACGNGVWKPHAPWCELAYLFDAHGTTTGLYTPLVKCGATIPLTPMAKEARDDQEAHVCRLRLNHAGDCACACS